MKRAQTVLWCLGLVVYVTLFYATPMPHSGGTTRRVVLLSYLLLPDVLAEGWFGTPPEFAVADRLPVLLIAGVILAYAWSLGWLLMAVCRADRGLTRLEKSVFATAVGLNVVSTYVLAAGLLGWLDNVLVFALPAALTLAAALPLVWHRHAPPNGQLRWRRASTPVANDHPTARRRPADGNGNDWLSPRWLWLGAPFVLVIVLGGMLPPLDFDVREYHLQVPKEFFQQGRIGFLPHNVYGNMAMGSEMLSLLAMVIAGDWWLGALAGKTVIAAMAPLTALGLFAAGRRFFSTTAGVVAAVVYISIPWVVGVSTAGLVEGASAYYLLLSVYAVLLYQRRGEKASSHGSRAPPSAGRGTCPAEWAGEVLSTQDDSREPHLSGRGYSWLLYSLRSYSWLLLGGYLAGGAVACKYPAVLFVVLPLTAGIFFSCIGWVEWGEPQRKSAAARKTDDGLRSARSRLRAWRPVGVFLLAAFLGCGLWFGKDWVLTGNPTYPLLYEVFGGKTRTPAKNRQWNNAHRPHDFTPSTLAKDLIRVGLTSQWLSPVVIPLAVLAFAQRRHRRLVIVLLGYFGYLIAAWWLFTHRIDRFWIPALPLLALLAGAGACWSDQRWWRRLLIAMLLISVGVNFPVAASGYNPYFVRLERLRHDPERVDPWHRYFNTHVERGRVLMVGEAQVFDLEVPVLYNTCFDDCLFEQLVRGHSAEEIRAALAARRISYVYVDWGEIQRYRCPGNYGFTDFVRPAIFEELVREGILQPLPAIEGHPGRGYRVQSD
jgi:4-amino-4-deoxy-L-arabinose transferase-like glycosyltransferase